MTSFPVVLKLGDTWRGVCLRRSLAPKRKAALMAAPAAVPQVQQMLVRDVFDSLCDSKRTRLGKFLKSNEIPLNCNKPKETKQSGWESLGKLNSDSEGYDEINCD